MKKYRLILFNQRGKMGNISNKYKNLDKVTRINVTPFENLSFDDAIYIVDNEELFSEKFVKRVRERLSQNLYHARVVLRDVSG